jgi:hypothetical protein
LALIVLQCYCANTLSATSALASINDCSMTCAGNASEYCGGSNRLNTYQLAAQIAAPASTRSRRFSFW